MAVPTNSFLYCPVLLAASHFLDDEDRQAWRNHEHAAVWWDEVIGILQHNDIQNDDAFRAAYRFAFLPENRLADIPARDQCSLTEIVAILADSSGHIHNETQDFLIDFFGGADLAMQLDRRANVFHQYREDLSLIHI